MFMNFFRIIVLSIAVFSTSFALSQGGKKIEALKKITSISQAKAYIQGNHKPTARLGNFSKFIDSIEYKEIQANFKVGDVFYHKKATVKLLGNEVELISRCQYIYLDGNKLSRSKIDSLRTEIILKFNAGVPFKNLANQFSMEPKVNGGDSGWFHKSRMGEKFCNDLTYKKLGEIYTFDNEAKNAFYVVLKTHNDMSFESWVYIAM